MTRLYKPRTTLRTMLTTAGHRFLHQQYGGIAPFVALGFAGIMIAGSWAFDVTRMNTSAAQVKRATDAAAMAVAAKAINDPRVAEEQLKALAEQYVWRNLGMDTAVNPEHVPDVKVNVGRAGRGYTYTVSTQLKTVSALFGAMDQSIDVHSTSYVENKVTELAVVLPENGLISRAERKRVVNAAAEFVDKLYNEGGQNKNLMVSVVPYGQNGVNVIPEGERRLRRMNRWVTTESVSRAPQEMERAFPWSTSNPRVNSHAHTLIPDTRANRLCVTHKDQRDEFYPWRGDATRQFVLNYKMDQTNAGRYRWRIALYANNDVNQYHYLVENIDCPQTALLPLQDSREKAIDYLEKIDNSPLPELSIAYSPGLIWAGRVLSSDMRGSNGWEDSRYPLDFNPDGRGVSEKYILMFAIMSDFGFMEEMLGNFDPADYLKTREAFLRLCNEYVDAGIRVFFVGLTSGKYTGGISGIERNAFDKLVMPGIRACTNGGEDIGLINVGDVKGMSTYLDEVRTRIMTVGSDIKLVE